MSAGARYPLLLPDLGLADTPLTASLWLVEPGTLVNEGDRVIEILAGAATIDLPAPTSGKLIEFCVGEDDPVTVGQILAIIERIDEKIAE
jgi:pyruvate/2-oxoglutarate dehydrogenase complex dihydrolipoamide acyltransferase (E2) component